MNLSQYVWAKSEEVACPVTPHRQVGRCRQMSADVGRCRQMSADVGRCRQGGAAAGGKGCGCLLRWRRCTGQCALRRDPGDAGVGDPHRCGLRDLFWRLSSCNATQQKINRNQQTIEKRNKNTKRILEPRTMAAGRSHCVTFLRTSAALID